MGRRARRGKASGSSVLFSASCEDRHLCGRSHLSILGTDREDAEGVAESDLDAFAPGGEFGSGPLEAVIAMPKLAGGERGPADVEIAIGGGEHDHARSSEFEEGAFEGGQTMKVEVLDDFHHCGGIEAREPAIAISQGTVQQLNALVREVNV